MTECACILQHKKEIQMDQIKNKEVFAIDVYSIAGHSSEKVRNRINQIDGIWSMHCDLLDLLIEMLYSSRLQGHHAHTRAYTANLHNND